MTKKETKNVTKAPEGYTPRLQALYKEKSASGLAQRYGCKEPDGCAETHENRD